MRLGDSEESPSQRLIQRHIHHDYHDYAKDGKGLYINIYIIHYACIMSSSQEFKVLSSTIIRASILLIIHTKSTSVGGICDR